MTCIDLIVGLPKIHDFQYHFLVSHRNDSTRLLETQIKNHVNLWPTLFWTKVNFFFSFHKKS